MQFQKVTIAGVGLLGGSLGLAVKQRGLAAQVTGLVRRPESVRECLKPGVVDHATTDPKEAVANADFVVLCTPIGQMRETVVKLSPALKPGALVTDVGSVKGIVVLELEPLVARAGGQFVGSHPMAGSEKTGPAAASADLFEGAVCAVTPGSESLPEAVARVEQLWRSVGASTLRLSPELHDELVSRSSHLPHVAAATLASYVLDPASAREQAALCANGFWDTTRIASGSPEMWRDIALANRENLERSINAFVQSLEVFKQALKRSDAKAIEEFFNQAKKRRDAWRGQPISPSPE